MKCDKCDENFNCELDLEWHKETNHEAADVDIIVDELKKDVNNIEVPEQSFICLMCEFICKTEVELKTHMQVKHKTTKVIMDAKDQTVIECGKCDFKCKLNMQLKKHMLNQHNNILKYKCKACDFETNLVADIWEHTLKQHPDASFQFNQTQTENFTIKMVAEQNVDMMEEVEILKKDFKGAFEKFADIVESSIAKIKEDSDNKCKVLANTIIKLHKKINRLIK